MSQKNHYVPKFLLRRWATDVDGKLGVFTFENGRVRYSHLSPKNTGFEYDIYTLVRDHSRVGVGRNGVEDFFGTIETQAALVLEKLERGEVDQLSGDERSAWASFVLTLMHRYPERVGKITQEFKEELDKLPEEYAHLRQADDPPSLTEWVEQHSPGYIGDFAKTIITKVCVERRLGQDLINRPWHVFEFPYAKNSLLLSDHPCFIGSDPRSIILPVGPRRVFILSLSQARVSVMKESTFIKSLNRISIESASKRVFALNDYPRQFVMRERARFESETSDSRLGHHRQ